MPMHRTLCFLSTTALAALGLVAACDRSDTTHSRSTFGTEDNRSRSLGGHVFSEIEPVPDAVVRLTSNSNDGADALFEQQIPLADRTFVTDPFGFYAFNAGPSIYDLTIRNDHLAGLSCGAAPCTAARELVAFRGVQSRYFEPQIGGGMVPQAFVAPLQVAFDPPLDDDSAVTFFAFGDDVASLRTEGRTVELGLRRFETSPRPNDTLNTTTATLHAVVYPKNAGILAATAFGHANLLVRADQANSVVISLTQLSTVTPPTAPNSFSVFAPSGFTIQRLELWVDFGNRTISQLVATPLPNEVVQIPVIWYSWWRVRARATRGAIVSESELRIFDILKPVPTLTVPDAPVPVTVEGLTVTGDGEGMREHVFVPVDPGGTILSVLTTDRTTTLPNPQDFGLPAAAGRYTWTMRQWPQATRFENFVEPDGGVELGFNGRDARVNFPSSMAAPVEVVLH
ncbi:hypothetical protein AKJ09_00214 [Labilithrix luteola]|uniref:Lipoprotein n=1 Tax=Labilithrix luteola TaxID=1391654 RepID=A0A0K1PJ52_9BACT|nr:hypothetical protein [Labilithrix luteola]AKU93550.1 hypothetical protein AKJ09_00214 [Labilithrix luteola]